MKGPARVILVINKPQLPFLVTVKGNTNTDRIIQVYLSYTQNDAFPFTMLNMMLIRTDKANYSIFI